MSATPETDIAERMAFSQEYMVPTDVVRLLERERDEARNECKGLWAMVDTEKKKAYNALRERDEAREQIEVCRGIIERTVIARNSALSDLTVMERDCDEARAVIRMLWEMSEIYLDLDDDQLARISRSWGATK